jgi:hypothetical protein
MSIVTNASPVQMPGTASPTPMVASYVITAARAQPTQSGFSVLYTIQALAVDGKTVINPPMGWQVPANVAAALQAAVMSALDAVGPVQLKPVLVSVGGYNGP